MATLKKVDVENLHFEHTLWQNELSFFQDELAIYEKRLEKIVNGTKDNGVLAELEHFQNQFIRQKEVLDQLKHDIKVHEQAIGRMLREKTDIPETDVDRHNEVEEDLSMYRKIYGELKGEFLQFLAKHL